MRKEVMREGVQNNLCNVPKMRKMMERD